MVILKDIDNVHRVMDETVLFLYFRDNVRKYFNLTPDEIVLLKREYELNDGQYPITKETLSRIR